MISNELKIDLLTMVVRQFNFQYSTTLKVSDVDLKIDKKTDISLATLLVYTKSTADHYKLRVYILGFTNETILRQFKFENEQGYISGGEAVVYTSDIVLHKLDYSELAKYLKSEEFLVENVSEDSILLEDGSGKILNEINENNLKLEV